MTTKLEAKMLDLATYMQASAEGRSLQDIADRYDVCRRTAERYRNKVRDAFFHDFEEVDLGDRVKRWRINSKDKFKFIHFDNKEVLALEKAKEAMVVKGFAEEQKAISQVINKIKSLQSQKERFKDHVDLHALIEAQGFVHRPGPKHNIDPEITHKIEQALLANLKLRIEFEYRQDKSISTQVVCPYGFLYGNRHYLVANPDKLANDEYRLFSLSNIIKVEMLDDKYFVRNEDFSLEKYAENAFGVFQEKPFKVIWRFSAKVAEDAMDYQFHPSQKMTEQEDGTLLVEFKAGGRREMDWHLYTWGDEVEVIEPKNWREFVSN